MMNAMTENQQIRQWMNGRAYCFWNDTSATFEITVMVEDCANDLGHPEWLDDDTHDIWDIAIAVRNIFESRHDMLAAVKRESARRDWHPIDY